MAVFKPFRAVRPRVPYAAQVAALPYDVMNEEQAREMAAGKPWSFLHVDRPEIDFPKGTAPYKEQIYRKAAGNLARMEEQGIYFQEKTPAYYIYEEEQKGRRQRGIVGCASIDDYRNGTIKKHELTRPEKETDRIRHIRACQAHTGPIFLTCPYPERLTAKIDEWVREHPPVYDFVTDEGVGQKVWVIDDAAVTVQMEQLFGEIPAFYIADGHHRAASAVKIGEQLRKEQGEEAPKHPEYERFLSVVFPAQELQILGYHRIVRDKNGYTGKQILQMLAPKFEILLMGEYPCRPMEKHCFGMYLEGEWYHLRALEETYRSRDSIGRLDVSILQEQVLAPILGIEDPRKDSRLSFLGGAVKIKELAAKAGEDGIVFVLYPTGMDELMETADAGEIMPPKSTWFEPKIYSGLFVHKM